MERALPFWRIRDTNFGEQRSCPFAGDVVKDPRRERAVNGCGSGFTSNF
jgi:hypothetical protein